MFLKSVKEFLTIINKDALLFLGMRTSSIVLSIVSIIMLVQASSTQRYFETEGQGILFDALCFAPLAYSLVWSTFSLVLPGCQRKYHPVLDVVLDTMGWGSSLGLGGCLLAWATGTYDDDRCRELVAEECQSAGSHLSVIERSAGVLLIFNGLTHLVMFARACRAVHLRRKKYVPSRNSFMMLEKDGSRTNSTAGTSVLPSRPSTVQQ